MVEGRWSVGGKQGQLCSVPEMVLQRATRAVWDFTGPSQAKAGPSFRSGFWVLTLEPCLTPQTWDTAPWGINAVHVLCTSKPQIPLHNTSGRPPFTLQASGRPHQLSQRASTRLVHTAGVVATARPVPKPRPHHGQNRDVRRCPSPALPQLVEL